MATRKNFQNRREARQASAKIRQAESDRLHVKDKLNRATPGTKEHRKLLAKVEK